MKPTVLVVCLIAAVAATGCRNSGPSLSAARPTLDELPSIPGLERTLPVKVGVEGAAEAPRVPLVPELKEPELTQQERVALGMDRPDPGQELLALYRPPRDASDGVSPDSGGSTVGVDGFGGALVFRDVARGRSGVCELNPPPGGILPFVRTRAMFYSAGPSRVGVDFPSWLLVGEDQARRAAARLRSVDD